MKLKSFREKHGKLLFLVIFVLTDLRRKKEVSFVIVTKTANIVELLPEIHLF